MLCHGSLISRSSTHSSAYGYLEDEDSDGLMNQLWAICDFIPVVSETSQSVALVSPLLGLVFFLSGV